MLNCRLILIFFLIAGLILHGCKNNEPLDTTPRPTVNQEGKRITPEIGEQRETASATSPAPGRKTTATLTPTPTTLTTPLASLTSTVSTTPDPTFTPLPTMDKRGILGLIDDNGGCQLPCWWRIDPGKTTIQQALQFLESVPSTITLDGETGFFELDGKVRFESAYQVKYGLPGSSQQGIMRVIAWDNVVTRIAVGPATTQYRFTLDQLLSKMGKPSQVYLQAKHNAIGYTIPYKLILYYPDRRFFANYYIEAEQVGMNIRACPAKVAPGLILWSPEYKIENRLANEMLGPDSRPGLQTLEDSTGYSIDDFYDIFSKAGFSDCLESPLVFWESLK